MEEEHCTVEKGRKAKRSSSCGGWRSASFLMGASMAERFAFYGVSSNLKTYLTGPLGQSTAAASENVNAWHGAASMLPLLGAFLADSYLGRYHTILFSSLLYVLGLGLLAISVTLPTSRPISCGDNEGKIYCSSSPIQVIMFFSALYISALAQGEHKPCIQAFGADQFDGQDPEELKSRSSFFNWWVCSISIGISISFLTLFYIQENLSWGLGFGITCIAMLFSLLVFLLGTKTYRYSVEESEKKSSFVRIAQVFISATKNWRSNNPLSLTAQEDQTSPALTSHQFKFLEKALVVTSDNREACSSIADVNEAKGLLKLVPIWCACLPYAVVYAQASTFFTKQGSTMDRNIGPNFQIPAASLLIFTPLSIMIFIPIYDRVFIPFARVFTGTTSGITTLRRIGFGMLISMISMVVAALIEKKRLRTALDYGLVDDQGATVPMSIWWLAPQYLLYGLSDVFVLVGLQEFFYQEVPNGLKSLGIGLQLSVIGIGSFLSSFIISILEKVTGGDGQESWFSSNLNRAHLDYFYWVLVGLNIAGLVTHLYFAKSYIYNK